MSNRLVQKLKDKKKELLFQYDKMQELKEKGWIKEYSDLYGDGDPTIFFPIMLKKYSHLLDDSERDSFSKKEMKKIDKVNFLVRKFGPLMLKSKQVYVDRNDLLGLPGDSMGKVIIPDEPVIFVSNHLFRDDILGTMIAAGRTAYALCGSIPLFFNTPEGILIYNSGVILINRNVRSNKRASIEKEKEVLKNGGSLIVYPEGVWNKSPNKLHIPLWNGVFKLAKETGVKIVPLVHYIKDPSYTLNKKENSFYTVIDDPIDPKDYSEDEMKRIVEDKFSTWTYLMMEKYGQATRNELLLGYDSPQEAWENHLRKRTKTAKKYDVSIETQCDFRPKDIVNIQTVYAPIANLRESKNNVHEVRYAKKLVKEQRENDFQHRF